MSVWSVEPSQPGRLGRPWALAGVLGVHLALAWLLLSATGQRMAEQVVVPVRNGVGSQGLPAGANLPLGQMNWGKDPSGQPWTPQTLAAAMATNPALEAQYKKALKQAEKALTGDFPVLERFDSEGRLKGDPRK